MEKKITIQTKTTAEDFKALTFFNTFLKKRTLLVLLVFAALFSVAAIIGRLSGSVPVPGWYFYVCLGFLALAVFQYGVFEYSVRRFLASDKLVVDNERYVVIDETGITAEGGKENCTVEYRWDMFFSAYETKKYFYLYVNTIQAVILPKREFKVEEIPVLRNLIREKLGRNYRKR